MNHQPYEELILTALQLNKAEKQQLSAHLASCKRCQHLVTSWSAVESALHSAKSVAPATGFVSRFQIYQQTQTAIAHRKQSIQSLIYIGIAMIAVFVASIIWFFLSYSPGEIIVSTITFFSGLMRSFTDFGADALMLFNSASPSVPFLLVINIIGWAAIIFILWTLTIWRFAHQGVTQNEQ